MADFEELREVYEQRRQVIENRLKEFEKVGQGKFKVLFPELVYCLLTPQSRARNCDAAVRGLLQKGLLLKGTMEDVADALPGVRFKETKAERIVAARNLFTGEGAYDLERILQGGTKPKTLREWFVTNVKGLGYKEASHFLRNVGVGFDLAILDRHILKNLWEYGVIKDVGIDMGALDLLFWSMETGEVFK